MADSKWLRIEEAADYLRCSERHIRNLVAKQEIPHTYFGGRVLFHSEKLDEWLFSFGVDPMSPGDRQAEGQLAAPPVRGGGPPAAATQASSHGGQWLRFVNWSEFPTDWCRAIDSIADRVTGQMPADAETKKYKGSYSFIVDHKTLAKLAPTNPRSPELLVGLTATEDQAEERIRRIGTPQRRALGPGKEPFHMAAADPVSQADEICQVVTEFLREALST